MENFGKRFKELMKNPRVKGKKTPSTHRKRFPAEELSFKPQLNKAVAMLKPLVHGGWLSLLYKKTSLPS